MFNQERFDAMPKFNEFQFWFVRSHGDEFVYGPRETFGTASPPTLMNGTINVNNYQSFSEEITEDFEQFMNRPEFRVGNHVDINTSIETMVDIFEEIITGLTFIRCMNSGRNPDDAFPSVTRFLNWIHDTDFYTAPGSTRFHDAFPSGLLSHSLRVYNNILDLRAVPKFQNVEFHSMALISLCHDFTKIGNYEMYQKNVKNDATGIWEQVPSYRWKGNPFPFGHGVASMYIVTQFYKLSIEEMLAIRWHMGEYNVSERETGELEDACEQYPMIRMLQFADQLACTKY